MTNMLKEVARIYRDRQHQEIADLLDSLVNLAAKTGVPPEFPDINPIQVLEILGEDAPLKELNLPRAVHSPLARAGLRTVAQARAVVQNWPDAMTELRQFGPIKLATLTQAIKSYDAERLARKQSTTTDQE